MVEQIQKINQNFCTDNTIDLIVEFSQFIRNYEIKNQSNDIRTYKFHFFIKANYQNRVLVIISICLC